MVIFKSGNFRREEEREEWDTLWQIFVSGHRLVGMYQ